MAHWQQNGVFSAYETAFGFSNGNSYEGSI